MGKCVFCGNLSNNKNNATLHKFPRDEAWRKQWIKLIGREGWVPNKSSFLCSDHFPKDGFVVHYNRKRLKPGTLPTILMKNARFEQQRDILVQTNCRDNAQDVPVIFKKEENFEPRGNALLENYCRDNDEDVLTSFPIIEKVPEPSVVIEYSDSSTNSIEKLSQENCFSYPCTLKRVSPIEKNYQPLTVHEKVLHDHQYENTPGNTKKKLNNLRRKLDSAIKENRMLKQRLRRLKKKVDSL